MSRIADPNAKSSLLRAAEAVFAERGVGGAKIEDIVKKAGVSKGAFYLHFESKEAALKQIIDAWLADCTGHFGPPGEYPLTPSDADTMLDFCIERDVRIYEFIWKTRMTMRVLRTCQGEYDHLFQAFRADMQSRNRAWLEQWQEDGLFRPDVDISLAVALISGAYEELSLNVIRAERRPAIERWLEFAQETFVRAYGTEELISALERRNRRRTTGIHQLRVDLPERAKKV